jgi:hypothetical protein
MIRNVNLEKAVLDTPNILLDNCHKGKGRILKNAYAITYLISTPIKITALITPKMKNQYSCETEFLELIIPQNNGNIIYSGNLDPDLVALEYALNHQIPLISNDRFRKAKYKKYYKVEIIRFKVSDRLTLRRGKWRV